MLFSYSARNQNGEKIEGEIEAVDEASALLTLRQKQLFISKISKKGKSQWVDTLLLRKTGIKDKIIFTQQLGIMIKSGLPVVDALKALSGETLNKNFARQINEIISDVKGGIPLSKALSKHPQSFDIVYINSVKAGEKSGKLDQILQNIAIQLEKDYVLISKIRGAMIYPIVILVALISVSVLVLIVVIPELKIVFDDVGVPLPLLTRVVIALSVFLQKNIIYLILVLIVIFVALKFWIATPQGKRISDTAKLHIPVFGNLLKKSYMAKFTRTFAGLSAAGLPLLDIFNTARDVINNVIYQEEITKMTKKIELGESISKAIKDSPLFPGMVGQLSSVGEKSGNIDAVFESMANFFDKEVDNITSNLSTLLEPLLMVIMGVAVGILIISVLQPIYGLVNAL